MRGLLLSTRSVRPPKSEGDVQSQLETGDAELSKTGILVQDGDSGGFKAERLGRAWRAGRGAFKGGDSRRLHGVGHSGGRVVIQTGIL